MNLCNVNVIMLSSVVIALFTNSHILCDNEDEIPETYKESTRRILDMFIEDCGTLKKENTISARIIGGEQASEHSHPWMVHVTFTEEDVTSDGKPLTKVFNCGGTLISQYHVLTAAHCFGLSPKEAIADQVSVYVGHSDIQILENNKQSMHKKDVMEIKIHENYTSVTNETNGALESKNDIAIVVMEYGVIFSDHVRPICLPPKSNRDFMEYNHKAIIVGWGRMDPEVQLDGNGNLEEIESNRVVKQLRVFNQSKILTNEECSIKMGKKVADEFICVGMGDHSFCAGDSGGPVIVKEPNEKYYQIGIASNGPSCMAKNNYPTSCSSTAYFASWIHKVVTDTFAKIYWKRPGHGNI